jgi:hypothetical protein
MDTLDGVFELLAAYQTLYADRRDSGPLDPELPRRWKAAMRRLACKIPQFEGMPLFVRRACPLKA